MNQTSCGKIVSFWAVVERLPNGKCNVLYESGSWEECAYDVAVFEAAQRNMVVAVGPTYATIPARYTDGSYDVTYLDAGGEHT